MKIFKGLVLSSVLILLAVVAAGAAVPQEPDALSGDPEGLRPVQSGGFYTHLPVILIDSGDRQIDRDDVSAVIGLIHSAGQQRNVLEQPDAVLRAEIRRRGASSYSGFDKPQYRISLFREPEGRKELEYGLLDMAPHSRWVLHGPFLDRSLIRNRLVYSLGRELLEWAPDSRFCEVFLNGEYMGVYLAVEPVSVGPYRIPLPRHGLLSGRSAYIVSRERPGTGEVPLETYGQAGGFTSQELSVKFPSPGNLTPARKEWIRRDISRFEEVLYGADFADPITGYSAYLDVNSFADYVILNELAMNKDAGDLSTYIYRDLDGKIKITIWDYNNAFHNVQWGSVDYEKPVMREAPWFDRLLQDPAFVALVESRYRQFRRTALETGRLLDLVDSFREEIGDAADRNFGIWGYTFRLRMLARGNRDTWEPGSYPEAVAQLKYALVRRLEYLDREIVSMYGPSHPVMQP